MIYRIIVTEGPTHRVCWVGLRTRAIALAEDFLRPGRRVVVHDDRDGSIIWQGVA